MMYPYPFFGAPYFRRPYYHQPSRFALHKADEIKSNISEKPCFPNNFSDKKQGNFSCSQNHQANIKNDTCNFDNIDTNIAIQDNSNECFEIFGLKLHFDDLLIIALLFFLYQEDVKDTYLYIALILLLLS